MNSFGLMNYPDIRKEIEKMNQDLDKYMDMDFPIRHVWADEQFFILKKYIQDYEKTLDPEHEVGLLLTNFGQSVAMQVTEITYEEPVLMVFKGFVDGREAVLIQHVHQLNFLMTSYKKEEDRPKRTIGFHIENKQD